MQEPTSTAQETQAQRLRVTFSRGEEIRYISHLDLLRVWERAFRRAQVPIAYSHGFNPHPKMTLAAPLPLGVVGERELLDVILAEPMALARFLDIIRRQMPPGMLILSVEEVNSAEPSLPAQVRAAKYRADLTGDWPMGDLEARVDALLQATTLPRERKRDKEIRRYDLRPLVEDLRVERAPDGVSLWMRLRSDPSGTGRPDEVLSALGVPVEQASIRRLCLVL